VPLALIIDDEANIRRMVGALLTSEGFEVRDAGDGSSGVNLAVQTDPDVVLLDLMMPGGMDGMATLQALKQKRPDLPVVMMSGRAGLADAVKATQLGAHNFLEKPLTPEGVLLSVRSALELRRARREADALRAELGLSGEMVGESGAMRKLRELIARVAPTDSRVLISGESGTGKELVAAAIHSGSERRDQPFIRVNCAALPRDLVESEMFGHERGAFTGASEKRIGRFELAHRGTLLLDEVGDLGPEAQAKLLRAIEAREIERLGGSKPIPVDVRIISATNKALQKEARDGSFREDLLFRLNVIPVEVPPLRERAGDIPALVAHFAAMFRIRTGRANSEWSPEAIALLQRYAWPGNVRELANIVERLVILHAGQRVTPNEVAQVLPAADVSSVHHFERAESEAFETSLTESLDEYERALILRALAAANGNIAEAARRLKTDRPNLYRRMKRLGVAGEPAMSEQRSAISD
jgi:two-component system nitrogen regulation response regulator NtrX